MIVITGASGLVGGPAIRNLVKIGRTLRALSSNATSAAKLKAVGVHETVVGDFRSDADLLRLMQGADTVIHIPPAVVEDENRIGFRVIEAARTAGVRHFIFISCFHSQLSELRHHHNKLVVEEALIKSGLSYTILQPAMFMQNIGYIWPKIEQGLFEWPWSADQRYAMLDTEDLGEAIAVVATQSRFRGGTYELCSPDTISVVEMARQLGDALGKPLHAARQDPVAWADFMRKTGAPEWSVETVLGMCRFHDAHGYGGGNAIVLETVLGHPARTYRDFARRIAAEKSAARDLKIA